MDQTSVCFSPLTIFTPDSLVLLHFMKRDTILTSDVFPLVKFKCGYFILWLIQKRQAVAEAFFDCFQICCSGTLSGSEMTSRDSGVEVIEVFSS